MKKKPFNNKDHSVTAEPHLQGTPLTPDPTEQRVPAHLDVELSAEKKLDQDVENTVWDEPALSAELAGDKPANAVDYRNWLTLRISQTTPSAAWSAVVVTVLLAGPWAILGTFLSGVVVPNNNLSQAATILFFGPVTEEVMKIALPLYLVEKKPYLFPHTAALFICVLAGGAFFAAVENLLYLNLYVPDPSPLLITWRWSICVVLHTGCSCIAGLGLARIYRRTRQTFTRPQLSLAYPCLVTAIVIHSLYNLLAMILSYAVPEL